MMEGGQGWGAGARAWHSEERSGLEIKYVPCWQGNYSQGHRGAALGRHSRVTLSQKPRVTCSSYMTETCLL